MKCSQLKFGWLNTLTGETKTHDFALGLGPCGRWVTTLTVEIDLATVRVVQTSYDIDYEAGSKLLVAEHSTLMGGLHAAEGCWGEKGHGWDNMEHMTPTKASWEAAYKEHGSRHRAHNKHKPEVKHFMYRLEDIRGRITAL